MSYVKNIKIEKNKSNKWNVMININNIRKLDQDEMNNTFKIVKEKEQLILKTEMMMQETSIYSDAYKPLFIYEMDENAIKEFSKVLNQKLRHVKLAISKANLGQNKYKSEVESMGNTNHNMSPQSEFLKKHTFNPEIFKKANMKFLFNYDSYASELIKQHNVKIETIKELKDKEHSVPKTREGIEIRKKIHDELEIVKEEDRKLKEVLNGINYENTHLKPSAARNVKLPTIKNNKVYNSQVEFQTSRKKSSINYGNIKSKYKAKEKMTTGEMFDAYQDEYNEFISSLYNPMAKLSKLIRKDQINLDKVLNPDCKIDFSSENLYGERNKNSKHSEEHSSIDFKK